MRKSLLLSIAILGSMSLFSQNGYWSKTKIGFVIGPKFTSSKLVNTDAMTSYKYADKGSLNFGAHMITRVNSTISINYGITSTWNSIERKDKCETCDIAVSKTTNLKYRYISVPLQMQVYFQNDRLDIFGIAGVNYNYLTKSYGNYTSSTGSTYDIISMKNESASSLFGLEVGAGVDYNLSYRASVRMNVTYQHYLNAYSTMPEANIGSFSVQPGIFYQF